MPTQTTDITLVVQATLTKSVSLNAVVLKTIQKTATANLIMSKTFTKTSTTDMELVRAALVDIDVSMVRVWNSTVIFTTFLSKRRTLGVSTTLNVLKTVTKTTDIRAVLQKQFSKTLTINTHLAATHTKAVTINCATTGISYKQLAIDLYVYAVTAPTAQAGRRQSKMFSKDQ